jgi:hypothetical protein
MLRADHRIEYAHVGEDKEVLSKKKDVQEPVIENIER